MTRRKFLRILGSGGIVLAAAVGGATAFVATRAPERARAPWREAGLIYPDPLRWALSYAILAPNPHNRQPWMVDLRGEHDALLYADPDRLLPDTDPFSRQITIGLGCFVELFAIAAGQRGLKAEIALFPQGMPEDRLDARPVAHLRLVAAPPTVRDPLFEHIPHRRTNREAYAIDREIPSELMARVTTVEPGVWIGGTKDIDRVADLRKLAHEAYVAELRTPSAYQESVDLMRIGKAEINAAPDGISLQGPMLEALNLAGVLTRETLADPGSTAFKTGLELGAQQALTAMGWLWVITGQNRRVDQIAAGRAYARMALKVQAAGLALQPMSQALQEYDAQAAFLTGIHDRLAPNGSGRVQMLARIGYAAAPAPAPRWALSTRLQEPVA